MGQGTGRGAGRFSGKKCRLICMFSLTTAFFLVEIIVGYITNSMALVADSFHMLSDIAALVIAFLSVRMAPKSWSKNTFGWARAEVLGALVNAVFLLALCFSITVESFKRFYEPEDIHNPQMILYVGAMGLVVNLIGLVLFHEHGSGHGHSHGLSRSTHSHLTDLADNDEKDKISEIIYSGVSSSDMEAASKRHNDGRSPAAAKDGKGNNRLNPNRPKDGSKSAPNGSSAATPAHGHGHSHGHSHSSGSNMNMRGVFLHVMADALGSVVVIISAIVMWQTDWEYKLYVDPGLSLLMVVLIVRSVWPLLIDSALILLQTVPTHIQVDTLQRKLMESVEGVLAVHEFHVWQLTGDRIIASAHIRCLNMAQYMEVAEKVKEFFHNEGIHSTTIQPEFVETESAHNKDHCVISCPKVPTTDRSNCEASKCCPPAGPKPPPAGNDSVLRRSKQDVSAVRNRRPSSVSMDKDAAPGLCGVVLTANSNRRSAPDLSLKDGSADNSVEVEMTAELNLSDEAHQSTIFNNSYQPLQLLQDSDIEAGQGMFSSTPVKPNHREEAPGRTVRYLTSPHRLRDSEVPMSGGAALFPGGDEAISPLPAVSTLTSGNIKAGPGPAHRAISFDDGHGGRIHARQPGPAPELASMERSQPARFNKTAPAGITGADQSQSGSSHIGGGYSHADRVARLLRGDSQEDPGPEYGQENTPMVPSGSTLGNHPRTIRGSSRQSNV